MRWKIFVTFFRNLFDDHYTVDRSFNPENFTFVKVNDAYPMELGENELGYDIVFEHDFPLFRPELQEKGYHENSVFYHIYKNGFHERYDYIGFIEYDHVLTEDFTQTIRKRLEEAPRETIFTFQKFTFRQLWEQGILMNPRRPEKVDGNPDSRWNCINVVLKDYNAFFGTAYTRERLIAKDCFPICHCFLIPSAMFGRIMKFHTAVIDSGKVERYHRHNWRMPAVLMERYLAVSLALEDAPIDGSILLEHRSYPVKVMRPDWFQPSSWRRVVAYLQKKF